MREAAFIKSNRDKWQKIDEQTKDKHLEADELANNYIELTDDLSYARTFYPKSQTVRYLNQLAARYFLNIYKYRKYEKDRFIKFWVSELPLIMYAYRKYMLVSLLIFLVSVLLGAFSQSQDPDFANLILSTDYVNQTIENIKNGDPMAIYKDQDEAPMFFMLSKNNIQVSFNEYIMGITACIGTIYILLQNGVMLGVLQYFFYDYGLLGKSMLSIWLHGMLEISALIIAGGAGLVLGSSWLFPGSYKRIVSLQKGAKDSLKIVVGLIPVFLVAAFIESYLTRLTEMPVLFNLIIIGLSGLFIIWYFFYYPYLVNKKLNKIDNGD